MSAAVVGGLRRLSTALGRDAHGSVVKRYREGTHRTETPVKVLARLVPRFPQFGITRLARITGFDRAGVEIVAVVRPNARGLSVAGGKGLSLTSAKVSGLMEAIEQWHAERPVLPLTFGDLDDVAALGLPAYHQDFPKAREAADAGPRYWAPALDLGSAAAALVPFELVHTCWLVSVLADTGFVTSTNGLASGSHPVEAVLHGLCELIERDACALFDRLSPEIRAARRVALPSVDDPPVAALLERLERQGFALALWDATTDAGTPVFLAAMVDERVSRSPPGFGSGCHPCRAIAALRAVTEAAQTRLIAITGARDDLGPELFSGTVQARFRWVLDEPGSGGDRPWQATPTLDGECLREDLRAVLAGVMRAGCGPVLAVDLSRERRLSVVRVLVPGLETSAPGIRVLPGRRGAHAAELLA